MAKNMGRLFVIIKPGAEADEHAVLHEMGETIKKREQAEAWARENIPNNTVFATALLGPWMRKKVKTQDVLELVNDEKDVAERIERTTQ